MCHCCYCCIVSGSGSAAVVAVSCWWDYWNCCCNYCCCCCWFWCLDYLCLLTHRFLSKRCLPTVDHMHKPDKTCDSNLVDVAGQSLPNIVPNVILAKREELIPLLMATIQVRTCSEYVIQMLKKRLCPILAQSWFWDQGSPPEPAVQPDQASWRESEVQDPGRVCLNGRQVEQVWKWRQQDRGWTAATMLGAGENF